VERGKYHLTETEPFCIACCVGFQEKRTIEGNPKILSTFLTTHLLVEGSAFGKEGDEEEEEEKVEKEKKDEEEGRGKKDQRRRRRRGMEEKIYPVSRLFFTLLLLSLFNSLSSLSFSLSRRRTSKISRAKLDVLDANLRMRKMLHLFIADHLEEEEGKKKQTKDI